MRREAIAGVSTPRVPAVRARNGGAAHGAGAGGAR